MWGLVVLLFATIFLWYLLKIRNGKPKKNSNYWAERGFLSLPGELTMWELMSGKKMMRDMDLQNYAAIGDEKCGGILEFGNPLLYIKDMDLARDIFIKEFDHFFNHRYFAKSEPLFEQALFNLKGKEWRNVRAFLSPTFTSGRIKRMFHHFERTSVNLKKFILAQPKSGNGFTVPVAEAMRKYAIEVIGSAAFGLDIKVFDNEDQTFFKMAEEVFGKNNLVSKIKMGFILNFQRIAEYFGISVVDPKVSQYFQNMLNASLKAREENFKNGGIANDDFMQLLVEARNGNLAAENSQKLSKQEMEAEMKSGNKNDIKWTDMLMMNQAFSFLSAGLDTVSNNLGIALYILAQYPEIQEKIFQEVKKLGDINYESVNKMEYTDMFLSEVLRLYPTVMRLDRQCMKDYQISGTKQIIPKGTNIIFVAEAIHRDPKHFPNPMEFKPERFSQEEKSKRHSYAYMPFGLGNRSCIGMRFALVETKTALANIVKDFEISLANEIRKDDLTVRDAFGYRTSPDLELKFSLKNL